MPLFSAIVLRCSQDTCLAADEKRLFLRWRCATVRDAVKGERKRTASMRLPNNFVCVRLLCVRLVHWIRCMNNKELAARWPWVERNESWSILSTNHFPSVHWPCTLKMAGEARETECGICISAPDSINQGRVSMVTTWCYNYSIPGTIFSNPKQQNRRNGIFILRGALTNGDHSRVCRLIVHKYNLSISFYIILLSFIYIYIHVNTKSACGKKYVMYSNIWFQGPFWGFRSQLLPEFGASKHAFLRLGRSSLCGWGMQEPDGTNALLTTGCCKKQRICRSPSANCMQEIRRNLPLLTVDEIIWGKRRQQMKGK